MAPWDPYLTPVAGVVGAPFGFPQPSPYGPRPPTYAAPYGAPHPMPPMHQAMQLAPPHMTGYPLSYIQPSIPGVPNIGTRGQPVPFTSVTFSATSGTLLQMTGTPLKPFKGRRLQMAYVRTGATATGLLTITQFTIGVNNQLVGVGGLPVDGYLATAFGVELELAPCNAAIPITMSIQLTGTAITMTDNIVLSGQLIGDTLGA